MTYEEFIANQEQLEAHFMAYAKIWNDGCPDKLFDLFPDLTLGTMLHLREVGWDMFLGDAHLEVMLRTAPPEMLEDHRKEFPELPTPDYVVRYLADYWRNL